MTDKRKPVTMRVPEDDPILEAIVWGYVTHRSKKWYKNYGFECYWGGKYTEFLIPAEDVEELKEIAQTYKDLLNGEI